MKVVNGILTDVNISGVTFRSCILPKTSSCRPGINMVPKGLTVHNTGNDNVPADNYKRNRHNAKDETGYHFVLDEKEIIQLIPINEVAWHAGDGNGPGNRSTIGVEICEREGAEAVAIKFLAALSECLGFSTENIKPHKFFSSYGKYCPWKILPHWDVFISNIKTGIITVKESKFIEHIIQIPVNVFGVIKEVDAINKDGSNYIRLRGLDDNKNICVGYKNKNILINGNVFKPTDYITVNNQTFVKVRNLEVLGFKIDYIDKVVIIS